MRREDRQLIGRVSQVNRQAESIAIRVLSGIADDDALSGDFAALGILYSRLGKDFTARAVELGRRDIEGPAP